MSICTALVFPVIILGSLYSLGLDGIWMNFVGVNLLSAILGCFLLGTVAREIRKRKAAKESMADASTV